MATAKNQGIEPGNLIAVIFEYPRYCDVYGNPDEIDIIVQELRNQKKTVRLVKFWPEANKLSPVPVGKGTLMHVSAFNVSGTWQEKILVVPML